MSHDSTAAPEAAARKLSGRRRKEIVAVLLFSGGPIFESSIPLSVFGIDRQDAGVPRYRLLVCGGEEGPLRTTGGLELTTPHGLEAISRAGTVVVPAWRSITSPPPEEALDAIRRAHEEGARIVGLCTGAFVLAAAGLLDGRPATTHWMYAPTLAKRYPSVHVDPRELFVDDGDVLTSAARRPESISVSTSCGRTTATRRPARSPGAWWSPRAEAAARSATSTGLYRRRSAPTRSRRSSPGRWSTSTNSSTWRRWRHART